MISPQSHRRGVALILVLSFIVLVTTLIVAFFSRSSLQRQIASSSSHQTRVDILAQSALEIVIGDLRQEIIAGSTVVTSGSVPIYVPTSNRTAVPYDGSVNRTQNPNLLKVSRFGSPIFSGTNYTGSAPDRASNASTTGTTANQRSISRARWNAPLLLSSTGSAFTPVNFTAPDWIIVTRTGVGTISTSGSSAVVGRNHLTRNAGDTGPGPDGIQNSVETNGNYAVGRFAYTIYDQGGLLDINVAGNQLSSNDNARRGRLHQADLSLIPGIAIPAGTGSVAAWRSALSGTNNSAAEGSGGLFDPKRDFIAVQRTINDSDQTFFSRQDLIAYVKKFTTQFSDNPAGDRYPALRYLSTFSREKNAPTWAPATATAANPNLATLRASSTNHEPMLKQRFPLNRLALLQSTDSQGLDWVRTYFGLSRTSGAVFWNYKSATGIMTLAEVQAEGREPDFFELLKAAIGSGSLGKNGRAGSASAPETTPALLSDLQILQIGANIIDQYDGDHEPTEIRLGSRAVYGVENLPYLVRVFGITKANDAGQPDKIGGWLQPELWNPHQVNGTTPAMDLRLRMVGKAETVIINGSGAQPPGPPMPEGDAEAEITFSNSSAFHQPTALGATAQSAAVNSVTVGAATVKAFHTGETTAIQPHQDYRIQPVNAGDFSFILEYKKGSDYHPYSVWQGVNVPLTNPASAAGTHAAFYVKADPRTDRFGVSIGSAAGIVTGSSGASGSTIRIDQSSGLALTSHAPTTGFTWTNPASFHLGLLSDNLSGSAGFYSDPDGVVRKADGAYRTSTEGLPLSPSSQGRGIVLNRPFKSVGELGYAFRDLPFKSLDFFTPDSADAALLDVFTIDDSPVMAGRINLNTRNRDVLAAMLSGALKLESNLSELTSTADADAIADAIVDWTSDTNAAKGPLTNRANLVTKLGEEIGGKWASNTDQANKVRREAAIRALADVSNTRTWNLLIDVIAQSGRYSPSAKVVAADTDPLNKYFIVEGECRYWLHLAIDRYTGEIVAKQLERVTQ